MAAGAFGPSSYGDAFADVYDDWYADASDVPATVARLMALAAGAGGGPVLELGAGTGRIALPLAAAGVEVHAVEASDAMAARLRAKPGGDRLPLGLGDMADVATLAPGGPYAVVFVAFNTFFNLPTPADQARCLAGVASVLAPDGVFVVEAFVPADPVPPGGSLGVRSVSADAVVLTAALTAADGRTVTGSHVELTGDGVRLRPWRLRLATPAELDELAAAAGLALAERHAGWQGEPFGPASGQHVSVYRRAGVEGRR